MSTPIRIAVVNDYEIVVAGIAAVLRPFAERVRVVELDTRMSVASEVDVILYDTYGQEQANAKTVAKLVHESEGKVLVFSWNIDDDMCAEALGHGVRGVISKGLTGEELVRAIERVHAGETVCPETGGPPADDRFGRWPGDELGLSPRESEVLALICQGMSNQEISQRAFLGVNTIKTHIRTLYRKIDVASRTQAVLWGVEHGFSPDRSRHVDDPRDS